MFDFDDAMSNLKSKEIKRCALTELATFYSPTPVPDSKDLPPEGNFSQYMTQVHTLYKQLHLSHS